MKYFKKLIGKKCYLSPIHPDDVEKYVTWLNDMEVAQHLTLAYRLISLPAEKEMLEKLCKQGHNYAIVESKGEQLIGGCGLHALDPLNRTAEVGLFIGEKGYWNKGYGEEALRLLLDYGFNILNLNNIMLNVYAFNARAIRCYHKVGFREIGRRRQARILHGRCYDILYMDLLAEEFSGSSLPPLPSAG